MVEETLEGNPLERIALEREICQKALLMADAVLDEEKGPRKRGSRCGHGAAICVYNVEYVNGEPTGWTAKSINVWTLHAAARGESDESIRVRHEKYKAELDLTLVPELETTFVHAACAASSPDGRIWLLDPTICQYVDHDGKISSSRKDTGQSLISNPTMRTLYEEGYVELTSEALHEFLQATAIPDCSETVPDPEKLSVEEIIRNTPVIPRFHEIDELITSV